MKRTPNGVLFVLVMKIEFVSVTDGFPEGNEPAAGGGCREASDYRRNGVQGSNRVYAALGESQWQRSTMTSKLYLRSQSRVPQRDAVRFPSATMRRWWDLFALISLRAAFPACATKTKMRFVSQRQHCASFFIEKVKTICYNKFRQQVKNRNDL